MSRAEHSKAILRKVVTIFVFVFVVLSMTGIVPASAYAQEPSESTHQESNWFSGIFKIGDFALGAVVMFVTVPVYIVMKFTQLVLGFAGMLLNYSIIETVLEFATNFGNTEGVFIAWGIIRDFGNIFLLFGFIWIGIATILNLHNYDTKKTLVRLLIFAVLTNFSLLAAELVIDTSNAITHVLATQVNGECAATGEGAVTKCANDPTYGIAGRILETTGVTGAFNHDTRLESFEGIVDAVSATGQIKSIFAMLMITILMSATITVLLAASIMLIIRAVVLSLLMITAPIGFVGMVVPFLGDLAQKWWHTLINQSFFAPAYVLLVFISLRILEGTTQGTGAEGLFGQMVRGEVGAMSALLLFVVVIGFMTASLTLAKQMGAVGADFAIKTSSGVARTLTLGGGLGAIGLGARGLMRAGAGVATKVGITPGRISRIPLVGGTLARGIDSIAQKSGDPRALGIAKLFGPAAGIIGEPTHAQREGYRGVREEAKKKKEEVMKIRVRDNAATDSEIQQWEEQKAGLYEKLLDLEKTISQQSGNLARQGYSPAQIKAMLQPLTDDKKEMIETLHGIHGAIKQKKEIVEQEYARELMQQAQNPIFIMNNQDAMRELGEEIREGWSPTLSADEKRMRAFFQGLDKRIPKLKGRDGRDGEPAKDAHPLPSPSAPKNTKHI